MIYLDANKEILEKLESSKPLTDVLGSSYAFKMTLRSGRKSSSYAHDRSPIELPGVKNDSYGDFVPKTTNRSVRFKGDGTDASSKINNSKDIKSSSFSFSKKSFCVNDSMDLLQRRLKNNSFGNEMNTQFMEKVGPDTNGIWVRMKTDDNSNTANLVIRKSKSIYKQVVGDTDQVPAKSMPKMIMEKYMKFCQKREKSNNFFDKSDGLRSSHTADHLATSQIAIDADLKHNDRYIPEDQISDIEIIGTSKLKSEAQYAKRLTGPKFLIKNHYLNEDGEGEPMSEEEVLYKK